MPSEYKGVLDPRGHTEHIDEYLKQHSGTVFNEWIYGSDLALQQSNKYFIDTRNIIFSDKVNQEYDLFMAQPQVGFPAIANYGFKYFLIGDSHPDLLNWMRASGNFREVIKDESATLFERTEIKYIENPSEMH